MTTEKSKTATKIHTETKQDIPQSEIDALAHLLLPAIRKFYENEENQKQFEVWKLKHKMQ